MSQNDCSSLLHTADNVLIAQESRNYDSLENQPQHTSARSKVFRQYVAAISATLSAVATGCVLGWTSPILSEIEKGKFNNISVNDGQMGWIGSFVALGAMVMCVPAGLLCDLWGTKRTLLLLGVPFAGGWGLIFVAQSVEMLYLGRFVAGMAAGACCVAAPLYISEIAQPEIRGTLGSYFQLMVCVGILLAYVAGKFLSMAHYTFFCVSLPLIFIHIFVLQPTTPTYYLKMGKSEEALLSLNKLRGCTGNETELSRIENELKENTSVTASLSQSLKKESNLKALVIVFALMFFQQFSGINAVILYSSDIFLSAGVNWEPNDAAIIVGGFQVVATFASSLLVDKLGRRILLIFSALAMAISSIFLAVFFTFKYRTSISMTDFGFVPLISLSLFVIVFAVGLGPIPWLISSELFPNEIKSIASSTAICFNWFLAFLVTKFYLQVSECVGQDTTFYMFSVISFIAAIVIYCILPETKGKTVEEVHRELSS